MFESLVDLTDFYPQQTPTMSSAKPAVVVGSEVEGVKSAWQSTKAQKEQECYFSENDFPLLETKPEVDRKCKKVRRHAGVALMQKKLADRGYVLKNIVEDHGVGKKRKARLLSEHSDDFQVFVPYSLNRKNRWNTVKLESCLAGATSNEAVKVSGIEGYLGSNIQILATKYVEKNLDDSLTTRTTGSSKGAPVNVLSEPPKEKKLSKREQKYQQQLEELCLLEAKENLVERENSPELHVQYNIVKTHPVTKFLLGKCGRGRCSGGKTTVRRTMTHVINKDYLEDCGEIEVEPQEEPSHYIRQPRHYTLADYITQDTTPVMVRAKSIQSIDDESTSEVDAETKPSGLAIQVPKILKDAIFVSEKYRSAQIGINDWAVDVAQLEKRADLRFHWLNPEKTRFTVDLTALLTENPSPSKMELVLFFEKLVHSPKHTSVLFNAAFKPTVNIEFLKREITCYNAETLEGFVDVVVKRLKKHYVKNHPSSTKEQETLKSAFNSREISTKANPWNEYRIMDADSSKHSMDETFMITDDFFESMMETKKEVDEESDLEDFERIEMEELLSEDEEEKENETHVVPDVELVQDFGHGCDICDETSEDDVQMLENCGHKFCTNCLRTYLTNQIHTKCLPLACFHETCQTDVPLSSLPAVLPLPLVSFYLRYQFVASHLEAGRLVTECPESKEIVVLDDQGDYGQTHCAKCGLHWCLSCKKAPHWPLNCDQAREWDGKFAKQCELDAKREKGDEHLVEKKCFCGETMQYGENRDDQASCDSCGRVYQWQSGKPAKNQYGARQYTPSEFILEVVSKTKPGNLIAQPYANICAEMKTRRFDMVVARQFAKHARKLTSAFKIEHALVEHRKTVLHLLEFGYAWLYMTRTNRPSSWAAIKANLSTLRGQYDALEKEILDADIKSTNIDSLVKKLDDSVALTKKTIDELKNLVH